MAAIFNVQNSCDFVIRSVRDSFLNYSIQETPFYLYITIRKSFSKASSDSTHISSILQQTKVSEELEQKDGDLENLTVKEGYRTILRMLLMNVTAGFSFRLHPPRHLSPFSLFGAI